MIEIPHQSRMLARLLNTEYLVAKGHDFRSSIIALYESKSEVSEFPEEILATIRIACDRSSISFEQLVST